MEGHEAQFIFVYFPFIDSELFREWDPRGYKLYIYMRRHLWRSSGGKLGGYYLNGWLAAEGYLGTWAKWLKISRAATSKILGWMEENKILKCLYRTKSGCHPNVYALGQVVEITGGRRQEVIYLDAMLFKEAVPLEPDTAEKVLAHEVEPAPKLSQLNLYVPRKHDCFPQETVPFTQGNSTVHPGERSNSIKGIICDHAQLGSGEPNCSPGEQLSSEPTPAALSAEPLGPKAAVGGRARPGPRVEADNGALLPASPAAHFLFAALGAEAEARGRVGPRRFRSVSAKSELERIEQSLGLAWTKETLSAAVRKMGHVSAERVIAYLSAAAKSQASVPKADSLDQALYRQVVESLKLNPEATELHGKIAASVTHACMKGGYTVHHVRRAGRQWYGSWMGREGRIPKESEFVGLMEQMREQG